MSRKHKIIISITGIFLVLLILVGLTYGYFLTRIKGNTNPKSISGKIANLSLVYGGDDGSIIGEGEVIIPGTTFDSKTFTVKNTGNAKTDYAVVIENVSVTYAETIEVDGVTQTAGSTTTFASNDFAYTLTCTSGCNGVDKETTFPIEGGILVGNSIDVGKTQTYVFTLTYLETGVDQSADMNKTMTARINIKDISKINPYSGDTSSLAYNIINNAIGLTEQEKEAGYAELVATPPTKVGTQISSPGFIYTKAEDPTTFSSSHTLTDTRYYVYADDYTVDEQTGDFKLVNPQVGQYSSIYSQLSGKYITDDWYGYNTQSSASNYATEGRTFWRLYKVSTKTSDVTSTTFKYAPLTTGRKGPESVISVTQDEYGTSYYYRGAVKNNYVSFAGKTWRIVRINGDGTIRLVLDDVAKDSSGNVIKTAFNSSYNDNAYVGYMYGTVGSTTYDATHKNINDSTIKIAVDKWYENNLKTNYSNYLADTLFCNDKTLASSSIGSSNTGLGYGSNKTYYSSTERLIFSNGTAPITTATPTLKCAEKASNNYSRFTTIKTTLPSGKETNGNLKYPIGLLTADEVSFAGAYKNGETNKTYYLYNSSITSDWWLSSPIIYNGSAAREWFVNKWGGDMLGSDVNSSNAFRPSINLKADILVGGGDGTSSNPYTVKIS